MAVSPVYLQSPVYRSGELALIAEAVDLKFNPGVHKYCVGQPESLRSDFPISNTKRIHINGDGACWVRSLWQVVFIQVFANDQLFQGFLEKVAASHKELGVGRDLVKQTISILGTLFHKTPEERVVYLNHQNVDDTLNYFMRHVSVEWMKKNDFGTGAYDAASWETLKTSPTEYGRGPEVTAFTRYFTLENHLISKRDGHEGWYYYQKDCQQNGYAPPIPAEQVQFQQNKKVMMFAANSMHFEVLVFDPPALLDRSSAYAEELHTSLNSHSREVLAQVAADALFAKQLEDEERELQRLINADSQYALILQQQLNSETRHLKVQQLAAGPVAPGEIPPTPPQSPATPVQAESENPVQVVATATSAQTEPVPAVATEASVPVEPVQTVITVASVQIEPAQLVQTAITTTTEPQTATTTASELTEPVQTATAPKPVKNGFFLFFMNLWTRFLAFIKW